MKTQATPRPWDDAERGFRDSMSGGEHTTIDDDFLTIHLDDGDSLEQNIYGSNYVVIYGPDQEANAELIVRAVNCHDDLIKLAESLMTTIIELEPDFIEGGNYRSVMKRARGES